MQHPHGSMRRKDREITERKEIDAILSTSKVMHLALSADNVPFLVPLYFVYDGTAVYFHSAKVGTKIEILRQNPLVCFEVCQELGFVEADEACDFEARHRTVIGIGRAGFIEDYQEKTKILKNIIARFTEREFDLPEGNVNRTAVVRIVIDSIRGKCHGV